MSVNKGELFTAGFQTQIPYVSYNSQKGSSTQGQKVLSKSLAKTHMSSDIASLFVKSKQINLDRQSLLWTTFLYFYKSFYFWLLSQLNFNRHYNIFNKWQDKNKRKFKSLNLKKSKNSTRRNSMTNNSRITNKISMIMWLELKLKNNSRLKSVKLKEIKRWPLPQCSNFMASKKRSMMKSKSKSISSSTSTD